MSYTQYLYKGAGPGDCEEHCEDPSLACRECDKNNENLDMLRYHLSLVLMHLYDDIDDNLGELEQSIVSMCRIVDIDFNFDKTLKVEKI